MVRRWAVLLVLFGALLTWREVSAQGKEGDSCSTDSNCSSGLYCTECPAAGISHVLSVCSRNTATPTSAFPKSTSLPFNKYSWLTTHNSYAILGSPPLTGVPIVTFFNQEDRVANQLKDGVRAFMLDTYDFKNDVWLCHSFGGNCYDFTAFEPLGNTLAEIKSFLDSNPSEIITIIFEDYVHAPNGLTNVFTSAGLMQYWFPLSSMPQNGGDWPTLAEMITNNQRLLVFTSMSSKEASEGIAYQWRYMVENQYGDGGLIAGSCPNRAESPPMNDTSRSLVLQNYFPSDPNILDSCADNSDELYTMLGTCYTASGNRWSNFIAVDYYMRNTGGGVFHALDTLNGQLECGCQDVTSSCSVFLVVNTAATGLWVRLESVGAVLSGASCLDENQAG